MIEVFKNLSPIWQALLAGIFTWFLTALGALFVFFNKKPSQKLKDAMFGFAGGIMIAASFWSLLLPAIEMSKNLDIPQWAPALIGFFLGSAFLYLLDKLIPHLHIDFPIEKKEGIKTHFSKTILLVFAITLHNIPEGLAVGVSFGAITNSNLANLSGAVALAFGIGIQNMPEGIAVAMPLRATGVKPLKSFWYGQLSAIVEPIFALIGAVAIGLFQPILPYALAFAAGAMIYVVIEEVIPESQLSGNTDISTLSAILGFMIMMVLDVALG